MAKVIIKVDDSTTANAIALWFESEQGLEAFNSSKYAKDLEKATGEILHITYVNFDESDFGAEHEVELN